MQAGFKGIQYTKSNFECHLFLRGRCFTFVVQGLESSDPMKGTTSSLTGMLDMAYTGSFMDMLLDNHFIDEKMTACPMSLITGVGTGDYTFATAAALRSPKDGQTITRTWLVRDEWANGWDDPSGNNNGHGKGKFNFSGPQRL